MTNQNQNLKKPSNNKALEEKDPFEALKYMAYCRVQLPPKDATITDEDFINFAKWQICKERGILFLDPVWNAYGPEEILVEFFSISFDQNPKARDEFIAKLQGVGKDTLSWFEEMEAKFLSNGKDKTEPAKDEFEENF